MNTNFMLTIEQFIPFRAGFLTLAKGRRVCPSDIILYNLIRNLPIDRGFTPITNERKLTYGMCPSEGFDKALDLLKRRCKYYRDELRATYGMHLIDALLAELVAKL